MAGSFGSWLSASAGNWLHLSSPARSVRGCPLRLMPVRPRASAVIGASERCEPDRRTAGAVRFSKDAYKGADPADQSEPGRIQGLAVYASIKLPPRDRQAIVAVAGQAAMQAVETVSRKGVKAIVDVFLRLRETGRGGPRHAGGSMRALSGGAASSARSNSLGHFNVAAAGLYSNFLVPTSIVMPRSWPVGIVSQSGAFGTYFLALGVSERGARLSHFVDDRATSRNRCRRMRRVMADDPATGVIMIYLEGCRDGARLRASLRARWQTQLGRRHEGGVSESGIAADRVSPPARWRAKDRCVRRGCSRRKTPSIAHAFGSMNWSMSPTRAREGVFPT